MGVPVNIALKTLGTRSRRISCSKPATTILSLLYDFIVDSRTMKSYKALRTTEGSNMVSGYLLRPKRTEQEARAMLKAARAFVSDYPKWANDALTGNRTSARTFAQGFFNEFVRIELERGA